MHERFEEERRRVGFRSGSAFADATGISQSTVSRIENGSVSPSAEALAALVRLGGDAQYVLTGQRGREIDLDLLGLCEAGLRVAYTLARPRAAAPGALRARAVAQVYNRAIQSLRPNVDMPAAASDAANAWIAGFDDPSDPELLERALLRGPVVPERQSGGITVSASGGSLAAGRDIVGPDPVSTRRKR